MAGTIEGGLKAAKTNKKLYGKSYYSNIGRTGGMNGHSGGFAANRELARIAGAAGGRKSSRGGAVQKELESHHYEIKKMFDNGESVHAVAVKFKVCDSSMKRYALDNALIGSEYTPVENYWKKRKEMQK